MAIGTAVATATIALICSSQSQQKLQVRLNLIYYFEEKLKAHERKSIFTCFTDT